MTNAEIPQGVLDVAWAPNVGRTFHLIASCGKDNRLLVHRIKRGCGGGRAMATVDVLTKVRHCWTKGGQTGDISGMLPAQSSQAQETVERSSCGRMTFTGSGNVYLILGPVQHKTEPEHIKHWWY